MTRGYALGFVVAIVLGLPAESQAQIDYVWGNTSGGNWSTGGNWTPSGPPSALDNATIAAAGTYIVTLNDNRSINNLTLNNATATLAHDAGTLTVGGTVTLTAGSYSLGNAVISGGTLTSAGGVLRGTTLGSRLNDVTVGDGVLDFSVAGRSILLQGSTNFGSGATLNLSGGSAGLGFQQTVTQNNLAVNLTSSSNAVVVNGNDTLTWGASSTITNNTTGSNNIGSDNFVAGNSTFLNQGLIRNIGSGTLTITADTFRNQAGGIVRSTAGTISIATGTGGEINQSGGLFDVDGGTLTLGATNWINNGTIAVSSGTLNLAGSFTTAGLGTVTHTGGTVNVTGAVNNAGATLALNATTGSFNLVNGSITGGSITSAGGSVLRLGLAGGPVPNLNRLTDVSIGAGVLDFNAPAARVTLRGTSTLAGTVTLNGGSLAAANILAFDQTATLSNVSIVLVNSGSIVAVDGSNTITLASNTTVTGNSTSGVTLNASGVAQNPSGTGTIINHGLIQNINTGQLGIQPDVFTNTGTLLATAGRLRVNDAVFAGGPAVDFTNFSGGVLTGGTYRAVAAAGGFAELDFQTRAISTLAANTTVELNGVNTPFASLNSLSTNNGTLKILGGRNFTPTGGSVANTGLVEIGSGSSVSANLSVSGGGTVRGAGTIAGNLTYTTTGGTLSPGQIPGPGPAALTVTGDVALNPNTTALFKLNGATAGSGYDQLVVNGAVDLGNAELSGSFGYTPGAGDVLFLVNKTSAGEIVGTFNGLPEGATVTIDGYTATISYFGNFDALAISGGNDVVLYNFATAPVPEPASVLGIASLALGAGCLVRRKVRRAQIHSS